MNKFSILIFALLFYVTGFSQSQKYDLDDFTKISMGISGDLYLTQGSSQSVEIRGDEDDIEELVVEVEGERLKIRRKNSGFSWGNSGNIEIYVTMPKVEGISLSGSGSVFGKSNIKSDRLDLSVSGSGDMDLDINVEDLEISISGSGECYLKGKAGNLELRISGSGEIEGQGLAVDNVDARISGSGTAELTVNESLESSISGSGTIYYAGDPKRVNNHSSGSGRLKKI